MISTQTWKNSTFPLISSSVTLQVVFVIIVEVPVFKRDMVMDSPGTSELAQLSHYRDLTTLLSVTHSLI